MSEGTLLVDTVFLSDLGHDLRRVALEFQHANAHSDRAGDAVGHPDLADHVRSFAHNWDDRRAKMVGNIEKLGTSAETVGKTFHDVDHQLMQALKGEK